MGRTARSTPVQGSAARPGGEFFARPTGPNHRRYEALRAYLWEGASIEEAAARAGYSPATLRSAVRDFRSGKTGFFINPRPGPTRA
ncbi:MAG: helix-turn-helix domain containing protein, partial [Actinomycetota bacterium]|nr:helix-turn-helix domain containing protein [Actinomycetota bacterium]